MVGWAGGDDHEMLPALPDRVRAEKGKEVVRVGDERVVEFEGESSWMGQWARTSGKVVVEKGRRRQSI